MLSLFFLLQRINNPDFPSEIEYLFELIQQTAVCFPIQVEEL